jgi:hypothetical protein
MVGRGPGGTRISVCRRFAGVALRIERVPTPRILDAAACGQKVIKWNNIRENIS